MELHTLDVITDDPRFEGFGLEDSPSLLDRDDLESDITPGFGSEETRLWKPTVLRKVWKAPKVIGRVGTYNDFPGINLIFPAFSRKACDALRDLLEPNGELLPLRSDVGEYYFYNITTVLDALDHERSRCEFWCDPPTTAIDIDYFAFHEKVIEDQPIFRIYEEPTVTIVSSAFVERVSIYGLAGMRFRKIWPLPIDVNWRDYNKKLSQVGVDCRDLKRNSFVITLDISGDQLTASELKRINTIENELDSFLQTINIDTFYFGSYEGRDLNSGAARLFISCPDCDRLAIKLQPYFMNLRWPHQISAFKRYGGMHESNSKEVAFDYSRAE